MSEVHPLSDPRSWWIVCFPWQWSRQKWMIVNQLLKVLTKHDQKLKMYRCYIPFACVMQLLITLDCAGNCIFECDFSVLVMIMISCNQQQPFCLHDLNFPLKIYCQVLVALCISLLGLPWQNTTGCWLKQEIFIFSWFWRLSSRLRCQEGASLVAQWLRIRLPTQGTRVRALVQEDPTCCRATKPVRHNYWACTLEPASHNYWAPVPQLLKPACLEPMLCNKRIHYSEKPAHHNEE